MRRQYAPPVFNFAPGRGPLPRPGVAPVLPPRSAGVRMAQQVQIIGATPAAVLPDRPNRQYLLIQNATGSAVIYVAFGAVANITNGIEIIAGGSYELRDPAPVNDVSIVCPTGTATVRILEG